MKEIKGMRFDVITAEIGSTTTVVSAFSGLGGTPKLVVQGEYYTTVNENDVTIGIERALGIMEKKIGEKVGWERLMVSSSAAGGLKMTVHGLVFSMTARAGKEAALGAGAVVKMTTSGKLSEEILGDLEEIAPKLVLIAGGVDNGEYETVVHNAGVLAKSGIDVPFVYAGNSSVASRVEKILLKGGKKVTVTENVYPKVDLLNVEPVRKIIQEIFSEHIIHGPGMSKLDGMVWGKILPTPAAVMKATEILQEETGDAVTIDIGGATTDVDSFTNGSPEVQKLLVSPEPFSKRTVEGDLGVFINAGNVVETFEWLRDRFKDYGDLLGKITPYPQNEKMEEFVTEIAGACAKESVLRHAGTRRYLYGPSGRMEVAEGKDLTSVKTIFGTGGILSRSEKSGKILNSVKTLGLKHPMALLPPKEAATYVDSQYIFAACGLLAQVDYDSAKKLLMEDIKRVG